MKKNKSIFMAMFFFISSASHSMNFGNIEKSGQNLIESISGSWWWDGFCKRLVKLGDSIPRDPRDPRGEKIIEEWPKPPLTPEGRRWLALAGLFSLGSQAAWAASSATGTGLGESLVPLNQSAVQPFVGNLDPAQSNFFLADATAAQMPTQENKYDSLPVSVLPYEMPKRLFMEDLILSSNPSFKPDEWLYTTEDGAENYYMYRFKEYKIKGTDQPVYVTRLAHEGRKDHSLMVAYLSAGLIDLYFGPGHSPTIVPLWGHKGWMIASSNLPREFLPGNPHEVDHAMPERSEGYFVLSLLLDLMDITLRNRANIGTAKINDRRGIAVMNMDISGNYHDDYFPQLISDIYRDNAAGPANYIISNESKERFRSALTAIDNISEQEFEEKFNVIAENFEKALNINNFNELFDIRHISTQVKFRKGQMKWFLTNLDTIIDFLNSRSGNVVPEVKDDPYSLFLWISVHKGNIFRIRQLLDQGLKDKTGRALVPAAGKNDLAAVYELLERGSPNQGALNLALINAAIHENLEMVDALLNHGAKDADGRAMQAAKNTNNGPIITRLKGSIASSWDWLRLWR